MLLIVSISTEFIGNQFSFVYLFSGVTFEALRISDDHDKKKYRKWILDNEGKLTDQNLMLLVNYLEACWAGPILKYPK